MIVISQSLGGDGNSSWEFKELVRIKRVSLMVNLHIEPDTPSENLPYGYIFCLIRTYETQLFPIGYNAQFAQLYSKINFGQVSSIETEAQNLVIYPHFTQNKYTDIITKKIEFGGSYTEFDNVEATIEIEYEPYQLK